MQTTRILKNPVLGKTDRETICKVECRSAENHGYADGDFGFYIERLLLWWR